MSQPLEEDSFFRLAHLAIESSLECGSAKCGAFTTLYHHGQLRGCVGFVEAVASLYQTVIETARAAAFEDTRFWPVPREELPGLQVSLSILTKPKPTSPEQ